MLHKFYAVTKTSVYEVKDRFSKTDPRPIAQKIALKDKSDIRLGSNLEHGTMIAITNQLQAYVPEGGGMTSFQRKIEMVNTRYWGGHSSDIVALFTTKRSALRTLHAKRLEACDPRWIKETKAVLAKIGDDNPTIYVCRHPGLSLLPKGK